MTRDCDMEAGEAEAALDTALDMRLPRPETIPLARLQTSTKQEAGGRSHGDSRHTALYQTTGGSSSVSNFLLKICKRGH